MKKQLFNTLAVGVGLGLGVVANSMVANASELEAEETKNAEVAESIAVEESSEDSEAVKAIKEKVDAFKKADEEARQAVTDYEETAEMVKDIVTKDAQDVAEYAEAIEQGEKEVESLVSDLTDQDKLNQAEEKLSDLEKNSEDAERETEEASEKAAVVQKAYDTADKKVEEAKEVLDNTKSEYGLNDGEELKGDAKKAMDEANAAVAEAEEQLAEADVVDSYAENLDNLNKAEQDVTDAEEKNTEAQKAVEEVTELIETEKARQIEYAGKECDDAREAESTAAYELEMIVNEVESAKKADPEELDREIDYYYESQNKIIDAQDELRVMKRDLDELEYQAILAKQKWNETISEYGEDSEEAANAEIAYNNANDEYVFFLGDYMDEEDNIHLMEREFRAYEDTYNQAVRYKELRVSGDQVIAEYKEKKEKCSEKLDEAIDKYRILTAEDCDYNEQARKDLFEAESEQWDIENELEETIAGYEEAKNADDAELDNDIDAYQKHLVQYNNAQEELGVMKKEMDALQEKMDAAEDRLAQVKVQYGADSLEAEIAELDYEDAVEKFITCSDKYSEKQWDVRCMERDLTGFEDTYQRAVRIKRLKKAGPEIIEELQAKKEQAGKKVAECSENLIHVTALKTKYETAKENADLTAKNLDTAVKKRDDYATYADENKDSYLASKEKLVKAGYDIDWDSNKPDAHSKAVAKVDSAKKNKEVVEDLINVISEYVAYDGLSDEALEDVNKEISKANDSLGRVKVALGDAKDAVAFADKVRSIDPTDDDFNIADYSQEEKEAFISYKVREWRNGLTQEEREVVLKLYEDNKEEIKSQINDSLEACGITWDRAVAIALAAFMD